MKKGSPKSGTPTIEEFSQCPEKCSYQDVISRAEISRRDSSLRLRRTASHRGGLGNPEEVPEPGAQDRGSDADTDVGARCADDLLFELASRRYQHKSTVFVDWGEVFPNAACVVPLIHRLMHRADVVRIDGESYRAKEAKEREAQHLAEHSAKEATVRSRKAGR